MLHKQRASQIKIRLSSLTLHRPSLISLRNLRSWYIDWRYGAVIEILSRKSEGTTTVFAFLFDGQLCNINIWEKQTKFWLLKLVKRSFGRCDSDVSVALRRILGAWIRKEKGEQNCICWVGFQWILKQKNWTVWSGTRRVRRLAPLLVS